jgi:hypothetical protein
VRTSCDTHKHTKHQQASAWPPGTACCMPVSMLMMCCAVLVQAAASVGAAGRVLCALRARVCQHHLFRPQLLPMSIQEAACLHAGCMQACLDCFGLTCVPATRVDTCGHVSLPAPPHCCRLAAAVLPADTRASHVAAASPRSSLSLGLQPAGWAGQRDHCPQPAPAAALLDRSTPGCTLRCVLLLIASGGPECC